MSKSKWIVVILLCTMACGLWTKEAECRNIVLKSLVVNPSKTKTQTAMLKAYLPKETKPEDIIDLGDLKIDYDITNALYYIYKEFKLAPGESTMRQIEIKDIWVLSREEVDSLNVRAKELFEQLRETAYVKTAIIQQRNIKNKVADILTRQEKAMDAIPQTHIAAYRQNQEAVGSIKDMLAELEKMVIEAKIISGPAAGRVSVRASWWVILAVIISLGVLSLIFFIIWHRQAGITVTQDRKKEEMKTEEPPYSSKETKEK